MCVNRKLNYLYYILLHLHDDKGRLMSKARELAREYRKLDYAELYDADLRSLLFTLIDAVLSEPEPLRGWIEVVEQGLLMSVNINQIEWFGDQRIRLVSGDNPEIRLLRVKESYDSIKQKIKEAS